MPSFSSRAALAVPILVVFGLHAACQSGFVSDDAFISLRYAQRVLEGFGPTFTDGERVEGFTNPLFVAACVGLGALGLDLVLAARVLSMLGALLVIGAALGRATGDGAPGTPRSVRASGVLLALFAPFAVWAVGGLEQSLLGAAAALLVASVAPVGAPPVDRARADVFAAALLAGIVLLRADGPIVAGGFLAARFVDAVRSRERRLGALRSVVAVASAPLVAGLALLALRWSYYGALVPNTALAKVAFTSARLEEGAVYVRSGLIAGAVLFVTAASGIVATYVSRAAERPRIHAAIGAIVPFTVYVACVGGDIFPAYRQLVPPFAVLALFVPDGVAWLERRLVTNVRAGFAFAIALVVHVGLQANDAEVLRAVDERWEWQSLWLGQVLAAEFGAARPLVAVDAAGALPFATDLPTLDMLGLTDRYLATHPPDSFGTGTIGHELGDGAYVLGRRPDLLVFCGGTGASSPCFRSGHEMYADPAFRQAYRRVDFVADPPLGYHGAFFLRDDGALRPRSEGASVIVPAVMFHAIDGVSWRVGGDGRFRLPGATRGVARAELDLAPGLHRIALLPGAGRVAFDVSCDGVSAVPPDGDDRSFVRLERPTRLAVSFALEALPESGVEALRVARVDESAAPTRVAAAWRCRPPGAFAVFDEAELVRAHIGARGSTPGSASEDVGEALGDVLFRSFGLDVPLSTPRALREVGFETSPRDSLVVELWSAEARLATWPIPAEAGRTGPRHHHLDVAPALAGRTVDRIRFRAVSGDERFALRGLALVDASVPDAP